MIYIREHGYKYAIAAARGSQVVKTIGYSNCEQVSSVFK